MVKTVLPMLGAQVQPLVGELRSHMSCAAVKTQKEKNPKQKNSKLF